MFILVICWNCHILGIFGLQCIIKINSISLFFYIFNMTSRKFVITYAALIVFLLDSIALKSKNRQRDEMSKKTNFGEVRLSWS